MSCEEDEKELELKDLIVQTLEANGLLAKIKAQLRASVFMALDDNDKEANKNNDYQNIRVKKLLQTEEGRLSASLIRDFLECCNLDYTISVLDPELNSNIFWDKREKLYKTLKIDESQLNNENPVLVEYLKNQSKTKHVNDNDLPTNVTDSIQKKFNKIDTTKKGLLDKEKSISLFVNLFPNFSKNIMERFVLDEIESNDFRNGLNFDDVVIIYKRFYHNCCNVSNHTNLNSFDAEDNFDYLSAGNKYSKSRDDDEDSSDSSSAFKRNDKLNKEKNSDFDFDDLKPKKKSDEFFNFTSKNEDTKNSKAQSSLGELPPLNNAGNFQNKFLSTSNSKDLGKKSYDDDYDEDFTNGTPRTPKTDRKYKNRSALGSDEEIEDNLSYVDESSKVDEITIDRSISTVQGNNDADYIEDLSI